MTFCGEVCRDLKIITVDFEADVHYSFKVITF